ncbi:MAG: general secretion pathway protein GspD [Gammaproteobacteria bacterium]|nr:general secretion pathway protein GspD [Gammaproteobacteria bacterium]
MRAKAVVAALLLLGGCASDRLHRDGLKAFEAGEYETAVARLQEAVKSSPDNATYRLDLKGKTEAAVLALIGAADRARSAGQIQVAESSYRRVLAVEPGNARAQRGLESLARDRRHADSLAQAAREVEQGRLDEAEARLRLILAEDPGSSQAVALRTRIDNQRGPRNVSPRLRTRDNRPVTLQFRDAATKMVFEVLARQTGINFIFDREVRNDGKTTIFVQQVPIEQAIDLVLGQNQLGRQVLSENMVLIYPNTAAKQKEYQDQVVRTFYMTNTDPKKTAEMLKTLLNAKTLFVDERASAVIMRDTPETLRMAERLIASVDVPEPEVMLEVEVLELTRSRLEQLGIRYPEGIAIKPTALAGDPLVLRDLRDQDSTTLQISDVAIGLDLKKSVGTTNILASPRIRTRNREKAKILIGQRVPVITTSTVLTTGGNGTSSNVQYVDVGLTLDVEPTVHMDNDVAIKVNLEVSSITSTVRVGDSLAYQIGTRNATTTLRLRDGETQVLAGLISDQDRRGSDRIPGLGDMPLLGRMFGSNKVDAEKSEIVLSITPRIIRSQARPASENTEFWYGTENSLRGAPLGVGASAAATALRGTVPAAAPPADATSAAAPPEESRSADAPAEEGERPAVPKRPELSWQGPAEVAVGESFEVTLRIDSGADLTNLRSMVRFDAAVFELTAVDPGGVVPEEARAALRPVINQRAGRAQFDVPTGVVTGSGSLVTLHFRALSARPASMIAVQQFAASNPAGTPVPTMAPRPLTLAVHQ